MMRFIYRLVYIVLTAVVGIEVNIVDYRNHPCIRECQSNDARICEYDFTLEYYYTLSKACYNCPYNATDCLRPHCVAANGVSRAIIVSNRLLPGPALHVCKDDVVIVNVYNNLESGEGVSIHWHGLHQRGHQHMDGVGMVTQCPIPSQTSFQYRFPASNPGTQFWHSHVGVQRSDGLFGAFVIREPPETEKYHGFYDFDLPEHTIVLNDWLNELTINRFASHHHAGGDNEPASILINGKGAFQAFRDPFTGEHIHTPYEIFKVQQGRRYRFRVISNGVLNCPIQFSIDNHTLAVIASDGVPFKNIEVQSFNMFAGERYDFVLSAEQQVGNYWLRVRGEADCEFKKAYQQAIIRYEGADEQFPEAPVGYEYGFRSGKKLNPWNKKETDDLIPVSNLESFILNDESLKEIPDKKFYLAMDFNHINDPRFHDPRYYPLDAMDQEHDRIYTPQINGITNILPPAPILTQYEDIPKKLLCNSDNVGRNCTEEFCECVHHLKVGLDETVELIIIDEGKRYDANHPMHLHGHSYRVVGMDRLNTSTSLEEVRRLDKAGLLRRNLTHSPAKDTVTIPDGGYTIIRFHANNPGFWLFHCHIDFHSSIGMVIVIQVGEIDQMPKTPKGFPRCGHWQFTGYESEFNQSTGGTNIMSISLTLFCFSFTILTNKCSFHQL